MDHLTELRGKAVRRPRGTTERYSPTVGTATATSLCLPFPLRPGFLVQIVVPRDMTKVEADRLREFISTCATASEAVCAEPLA